jgi:hypothetical protein
LRLPIIIINIVTIINIIQHAADAEMAATAGRRTHPGSR